MKKINLRRLRKIGIIKLVSESENLKDSYLEKSSESLLSSKFLLEKRQYNDSIALSYFSMYNSLLALLYRCGIKSENHNASIEILEKVFGINNLEIKEAKKERKDKQYYPSRSTNKKEVVLGIKSAEKFNGKIFEFIENLSFEKIKRYSRFSLI
jgi:uncharacterized protein (UPF0332 family)